MRKAIILIFAIILVACSKEDVGKTGINPPSWIQGIWTARVVEHTGLTLQFTSDNLLEGAASDYGINVSNNYGEIFDGEKAEWNDRRGDNVYYIDMEILDTGQERVFTFTKLTNDTLMLTGYGLGLEIEMTKRE